METIPQWRKTKANEIRLGLIENGIYSHNDLTRFRIMLDLYEKVGKEFEGDISINSRRVVVSYRLLNKPGNKTFTLISSRKWIEENKTGNEICSEE